jgi:hypothetical protein
MKRSPHFKEASYSPWFPSRSINPARPGWYECVGWRFNGFLHLHWTGSVWEYFGPKHKDKAFPQFGRHRTDQWRGLTEEAIAKIERRRFGVQNDMTGQRFGILTVARAEYTTSHGGTHWRCVCDCGNVRVLKGGWLVGGNTGSCGCRQSVKGSIAMKRPWDKKP